jgi:hypothetical protein
MFPAGKENELPVRVGAPEQCPDLRRHRWPNSGLSQCSNLIASQFSEARCGGCHLWSIKERDVDTEWDTGGASIHGSAERGLDPDTIDGCRHLGREGLARAEEIWPRPGRGSTSVRRERQESDGGRDDPLWVLAPRQHATFPPSSAITMTDAIRAIHTTGGGGDREDHDRERYARTVESVRRGPNAGELLR